MNRRGKGGGLGEVVWNPGSYWREEERGVTGGEGVGKRCGNRVVGLR